MDRTLVAVQRMLAALDAPAYDIGILSDRGMLPGLSNLPAAGVLSRLPLLKAHNARGAHIYAADGDTLHSGGGILLVHTASGGNRRITLRNGVAVDLALAPCSTVILNSSTGEVLLG